MSSLTSHCAILQTPILYKSHLKLSQFWFWLELFNLKQIKSKGTPWQAVVPLPFLSSAAIATISPWNATEPRPQYTASAKIQFQNQLSTLKFCSWRSMQIFKTGNLLKLLNDHTSSNTNLPGFGLFCHKPQQDFRQKVSILVCILPSCRSVHECVQLKCECEILRNLPDTSTSSRVLALIRKQSWIPQWTSRELAS